MLFEKTMGLFLVSLLHKSLKGPIEQTADPCLSAIYLRHRLNNDVYIDKSAQVHPEAKIGPNVTIGPNAIVKQGARIRNAIILDSAVIGGKNMYIFTI